MHTDPTPRTRPWALTWALVLATSAALLGGSATNARAGTSLLASATKSDNYGHPYFWAAPC